MPPPNRQSINRRGFLATIAAIGVAAGASTLLPRSVHAAALSAADAADHSAQGSGANTMINQMTSPVAQDTAIRPFSIEVAQADLDDLRRRIKATNWPERELVTDASQ